MEKIQSFSITELTVSGFKCFAEERTFAFGDIAYITGGNHVGKSSIADAVAFAVTGQGFFGENSLDRLYSEALPNIFVRMNFQDETGTRHELIRTRKKDVMKITYDGYTLRQADLNVLFGERDVFLSIFNPRYFIEILGSEGQELLQKQLPLIPHETVLNGLNEFNRGLLRDICLLSPDNFIKNRREEVRDLENGILSMEGQRALLLRQRKENAESLAVLREKPERIQSSLDALEAKKSEGLDLKVMADQLADLQLRYSELQNDPPKPIPTDDLDRQLRDAELAIERLNAKPYESKFTAALAETTAALNLAMREHGRTTLLLDGLKPNMKCPSCQRTVTAENLVDVKLELTQNLDAILQRGRNLRAQLGDLQGLDADSRKTFDRFVRTDVEKHTALMTQLTTQREILLAQQQRFAAAHEGNLQALYTQIRTLDTDITVGNLSIDETQTLSSLYAAKLDAQAELSALEVLCAREEPDLDARLADAAAQIKQKNILISAAVDY